MSDLSYAHGACPTPLLGVTIGEQFRRVCETFPHRDALVVRWQNVRLTYRDLWDRTTDLAKSLLSLGVGPGDRVGVWSANRWEWAAVQFATARVGAVLVTINPAYLAAELSYALRKSGVSVLFRAAGFRSADYAALLASVRGECPALNVALDFDTEYYSLIEKCQSYPDADLAAREASLRFDDPINIQYTSGTTGFPKGATLTHHNILNNAYFVGAALGYTEADRVCVPVPFYHCFGMVLGTLACAAHGACVVVPGESFDPAATLEAAEAEACTSLYGVPTMFLKILEDPTFPARDVSSLRTGIMAGSPCPVALMRDVTTKLHMPEAVIGYGMTETSPISTLSRPTDPPEVRCASVGVVQPHIELCVRDAETGAVVPRGVAGEFCARGYHVMRGYWDDATATEGAIDEAGWMRSGDLAKMDEHGYVHIVGRLKDMIIRGGENISPREVESVLERHPDVAEVQVVGVPSKKFGEEVMAWVRRRADSAVTGEELTAYCQQQMAKFKVPRHWRFVESFPMTVTGKVQKFRLREMAVEVLGLEPAEETA